MASIAAEKVARKVLETIGKGKRPNITKIAIATGYAPTTASTGEVQQTKTFKNIVNPYLLRLQRHQKKVLKAMEKKDLNEEQYRVLSESLSKITHDTQLLGGKSTENLLVRPILDVSEDPCNG